MTNFFKKHKTAVWVVLACLVYAALSAYFYQIEWLKNRDVPFSSMYVLFNGAYYVIEDTHGNVDYYNLPDVVTQEMIGPYLGRAANNKGEAVNRFYEYKPAAETGQTAVYLAYKDDIYHPEGEFGYAVFAAFAPRETPYVSEEYFKVYAIDSAEDIKALVVDEELITDPAVIDKFYHALYSATPIETESYRELTDIDLAHYFEIAIMTDHCTASLAYDDIANAFWWGNSFFLVQPAGDLS